MKKVYWDRLSRIKRLNFGDMSFQMTSTNIMRKICGEYMSMTENFFFRSTCGFQKVTTLDPSILDNFELKFNTPKYE